jgi:pimeloyl-ACP methyl ester carboxylesterase
MTFRHKHAPKLFLRPVAFLLIGVCAMTTTWSTARSQTPRDEIGDQALNVEYQPWKQISVVLDQGRYDLNALRKQLGWFASDTPQWQPFGPAELATLMVLQATDQLKVEVAGNTLLISLPPDGLGVLVNTLRPCRLDVPNNLQTCDKAILFVHGLEGGDSTFNDARKRCGERGIASLTFDYPNNAPPQKAIDSLVNELNRLSKANPNTKLVIVAHSLGGLITTAAITKPGFPVDMVTDIFTLGTPFKGSSMADFQFELGLINALAKLTKNDFRLLDLLSDSYDSAGQQLLPSSEFVSDIGQCEIPSTIRYHIAAGNKSFLTIQERELLKTNLPDELTRLGIPTHYVSKLSRLLVMKELQDGNADGAVTVESATAFPQAKSVKIFETTHFGLVRATGDGQNPVFDWVLQELGW